VCFPRRAVRAATRARGKSGAALQSRSRSGASAPAQSLACVRARWRPDAPCPRRNPRSPRLANARRKCTRALCAHAIRWTGDTPCSGRRHGAHAACRTCVALSRGHPDCAMNWSRVACAQEGGGGGDGQQDARRGCIHLDIPRLFRPSACFASVSRACSLPPPLPPRRRDLKLACKLCAHLCGSKLPGRQHAPRLRAAAEALPRSCFCPHAHQTACTAVLFAQFIKAMRDSDGAMMHNAHILGFFRRHARRAAPRARSRLVSACTGLASLTPNWVRSHARRLLAC